MDLLIADASVPLGSADGPPATGTPQYATDGNPGASIPATEIPAYWWNGLMQDLMAVLADGGVTPDRTVFTQLRDAIRKMISPGELLSTSGYLKLAGGFIWQWTTYSITPASTTDTPAGTAWSSATITFPISSPPNNQIYAYGFGASVTTNGQFNSTSATLSPGGGIIYVTSWAGGVTFPLIGTVWQLVR